MKQQHLLLIALLFVSVNGFSQMDSATAAKEKNAQDSIKDVKDSIRWTKLEASMVYPLLKEGTWSGVVPVEGVDWKPDPKKEYNLVFDLTHFNKDTGRNVNDGFVEIARIINLHAAAGIPKKNIHPVIVAHAKALFSLCNNTFYKEKYKKENPNLKVVDSIKALGIDIIACGQAMHYLDVKKEDFYPGVKVAVSAKTTLSYYVQQGYILYKIDTLE